MWPQRYEAGFRTTDLAKGKLATCEGPQHVEKSMLYQ